MQKKKPKSPNPLQLKEHWAFLNVWRNVDSFDVIVEME